MDELTYSGTKARESDVMPEGQRLIVTFLSAQEELERAKSRLNSAECALSNAHTALAQWLMPADIKPNEKIAVWMGDSLFQVEMAPTVAYEVGEDRKERVSYAPKVTVRTRGKRFLQLSTTSR